MTALIALMLSAAPNAWMDDEVVHSLEFREQVSALLAKTATDELAAGHPLQASVAAETCLRIDRYRCSCIRDAGLAAGTMKSADAVTLTAVQRHGWGYLVEYLSCDETAPDAAQIAAQADKWSHGSRWPYPLTPLPPDAFAKTAPATLLADGNAKFSELAPLPARRRFEVCALREPVLCPCVQRAGDTWLKLNDPQRAVVWWSRYLDCAPDAKDRRLVEADIAATKTAAAASPWSGVTTESASPIPVAPEVAASLKKQARAAVADKRLEDAVTAYTACHILDVKADECAFELAETLAKLDRHAEERLVYLRLLQWLPPGDKRRAKLKAALEPH